MIMTQQDQKNIREIIALRLGPDAVEQTYLNTNTPKNEAINRALSSNNPKTVTVSFKIYKLELA